MNEWRDGAWLCFVVAGCVVKYQCETEVVTEDVIFDDVLWTGDYCITSLEFPVTKCFCSS